MYILGPSSTIDMNCANGNYIKIELRDNEEIKNKLYDYDEAIDKILELFVQKFDIVVMGYPLFENDVDTI